MTHPIPEERREQVHAELAAAFAEIAEKLRIAILENFCDDPGETRKSMDLIRKALLFAFDCGPPLQGRKTPSGHTAVTGWRLRQRHWRI